MKKIAALIIALAMLITGANAESIFPTINTTGTEVTAISFGSVSGLYPAEENRLLDGSTQQVYTEVTAEQYNQFGIALGNGGYKLESQTELADGIELIVVNGSFTLTVTYIAGEGKLTITYPEGIVPEKAVPNLFPGYQVVEMGDTISVKGFGRITLGELTLNGNVEPTETDTFGRSYKAGFTSDVFLTGSFENTSAGRLYYKDIMSCTMYYITDENTYSYPTFFVAKHTSKGGIYIGSEIQNSGINFNLTASSNYPFKLNAPFIESLESGDFACVFSNVPDAVKTSETGIIAITITVRGAEKPYVVYVRY